MSSKLKYEEYLKKLNEVTTSIIPLSEYMGLSKPIKYKCLDCGHEWTANEARNAIRFGCPNCIKGVIREKRITTEEQFRKELAEKQPNLIPNDTYINNKTKYHCICKIHNCNVYTTPDKYLYRNQGCNMCSIERDKRAITYTSESFQEVLSSVNPNIEILSEYTNTRNRLDVKCKICGHKWNPVAKTLISKKPCGCPKCAGNAVKTTLEFEEELKLSHPELKLLSPYVKSNRKVHVLCTECNNDFWITPNKLQQNRQCPYCNISYGERMITDVLTKLGINFIYQHPYDDLIGVNGGLLTYDFYLPQYNLLIEFQGEQHEKPVKYFGGEEKFKIQQEHDKRKRNYAESHNIELLEIWYYDINLVEDILLKVLKADTSKSA